MKSMLRFGRIHIISTCSVFVILFIYGFIFIANLNVPSQLIASFRRANELSTIYVITPTYRRAEQLPELVRLGQTLLHVKNLVWIVVEDAPKPSPEVQEYLSRCGVSYIYLRAQMPEKFRKEKNKSTGVANRNAGLDWIKQNATQGVVYFGDDDNTYDVRLFEEASFRRANELSTIYVITPTYKRAEQLPELVRLGQTLLHVKNLVWIVVEDAPKPSPEVQEYLSRCGVSYIYLRAQMPEKFRKEKNKSTGVANRNAGLDWIKQNATQGVVYFGDDDNTYDVRLFEEIRQTKGVSMFPVGLLPGVGVSAPIVKEGKLVGFYDSWNGGRKFRIDMAGFAVNVEVIKKYINCSFPYTAGYEEDGFLRTLQLELSDIEVKADNGTKILVWHTQTIENGFFVEEATKMPLNDTNIVEIVKQIYRKI